MKQSEKILRELTIKAFHIQHVFTGDTFALEDDKTLQISSHTLKEICHAEPLIDQLSLRIITPSMRRCHTNSIMDIIPVSQKITGKPGEGITHTFTGLYVFLTGVDQDGLQVSEFGSSDGILEDQVAWGRPGTPSADDIILSFDVVLKSKAGSSRPGPTAAHRACDLYCSSLRHLLLKADSTKCSEQHVYYDKVHPGSKKVVIIKQVAGQGAMYDTGLLAGGPSLSLGCHSVIDMGNVPVILTPNEYRDGAVRAMY